MAQPGYNATVHARTRCGQLLLGSPELSNQYEAIGGTTEDLQIIVDAGVRACALNTSQSEFTKSASHASAQVARDFFDMQTEYSAVMSSVRAVIHDLQRKGANPDLVSSLEKVLANEAQTHLKEVEVDGQKKRKMSRSQSQEALRDEIEKDAVELLGLTGAHEALARRKVAIARLEALRDAARALSGKLAERASKKGARKIATEEERAAVAEQTATWSACYRLLAAVGARDPRVAELLKEARRGSGK